MNSTIDAEVEESLNSGPGGTAYYISNCISRPRVDVSKSLQRLKRRGIVTCKGSYWTLSSHPAK